MSSLMWSLAEVNVSLEEMRERPPSERAAEWQHTAGLVIALPFLLALNYAKAVGSFLYARLWVNCPSWARQYLTKPASTRPVSAYVSEAELGVKSAVSLRHYFSLAFAPIVLYWLCARVLYLLLREKAGQAFRASWSCPRNKGRVRADVLARFVGVEAGVLLATQRPGAPPPPPSSTRA